jgi:hypothetical protein
MSNEYAVKGSSISSKFEFVRVRFGEAAEDEFKRSFSDETGLFPVLDSKWYPFAVYDRINRAIADRYFSGSTRGLEEAGKFSAERVLSTTYSMYAEGKDFVGFLQRAAILHGRFYSQGQVTVTIGEGRTSATIQHSGADSYSDADLHVAKGFYVGAGELTGATGVQCHMVQRPDGAEFSLRWS